MDLWAVAMQATTTTLTTTRGGNDNASDQHNARLPGWTPGGE
jgi:hypothetical protein